MHVMEDIKYFAFRVKFIQLLRLKCPKKSSKIISYLKYSNMLNCAGSRVFFTNISMTKTYNAIFLFLACAYAFWKLSSSALQNSTRILNCHDRN